jgi:hypothetical protein
LSSERGVKVLKPAVLEKIEKNKASEYSSRNISEECWYNNKQSRLSTDEGTVWLFPSHFGIDIF